MLSHQKSLEDVILLSMETPMMTENELRSNRQSVQNDKSI